MTNRFVQLNKKELSSISGGMSELEKGVEDTLCGATIFTSITTTALWLCPPVTPVCAALDAIVSIGAFAALPVIATISKKITANNQTSTKP